MLVCYCGCSREVMVKEEEWKVQYCPMFIPLEGYMLSPCVTTHVCHI